MFSLLKGIQAIRDHHAIAYFADNRKVKVVVEEDQKWIMETWLPLAIEAGPKRIAVVTAPSGLRKLTVEDVVGRVDHLGLVSRSFESVEEARNWISKAEMHRDRRAALKPLIGGFASSADRIKLDGVPSRGCDT